jgi:acyl dehydratase
MGDRNPLYLDDDYRGRAGFDQVVAPPGMMQMWTMRNVNFEYAPGTTEDSTYSVFDVLREHGLPDIVAVSYDITFHSLLLEGDRAHHYTTVESITPLKKTALGKGHFVTEHTEFLDQNDNLYADAMITYFVYRSEQASAGASEADQPELSAPVSESLWKSDYSDISYPSLKKGQALPELVIPITHKLIVSCALATQDFMDVHHNAPAAQAAAMPDIFMNILTTNGLCARYLSDWAGPASRLKRINFKLMAPNVPGDTMIMQGQVVKLEQTDNESLATIDFAGKNSRGFHVTGSATLAVNG